MRQFLFTNIDRIVLFAFAAAIFTANIFLGVLSGYPADNLLLVALALVVAGAAGMYCQKNGVGVEGSLRLALLHQDDLLHFSDYASDAIMVGRYVGKPKAVKYRQEDGTWEVRLPDPQDSFILVEVIDEGADESRTVLISSYRVLEIGSE